jgi:AraC-like DNA-binding protein
VGRKRKPLLARALRRLHGDVAHAWSVEELAREAGLSRSVFSERFGQKVGVHPMQYLIEWRIALAKDMLQRDARPLSARHDAGLLTRFISLVRRHRQGFVRPQRDSTMSTVILAIISLLVSNCPPVSAPHRSCGWNIPREPSHSPRFRCQMLPTPESTRRRSSARALAFSASWRASSA